MQLEISIVLRTDEVAQILEESGIEPPAIPPGCNTVRKHIVLADGRHALVAAQSGFHSDDREAPGDEVNGLTLFVCNASDVNEVVAKSALEELYQQVLLTKDKTT